MADQQHRDDLDGLNRPGNFPEKLQVVFRHLRSRYPFITRLAIALHDAESDRLKTYAAAGQGHPDLLHYEVPLSDVSSLAALSAHRNTRVIHDLAQEFTGEKVSTHTRALVESGFRSSYTLPLGYDGQFLGFAFFNSPESHCFLESVLTELDMIGHMVALMVAGEKSSIETLAATVRSAIHLTHSRDPETGGHLERMARYARLIARELADECGLSDEFVEHIYLFAPLHDLGKIKVPDRILLKPGRLDAAELGEMKRHPEYGRDLIDVLIANHGLAGVSHVNMLRNIALYHHEQMNGEGYPEQLQGESIPLESRIVTVADVFDALTSKRPYKEAWPVEKAFKEMRDQAGIKWDARCVEVLVCCEDEVREIQARFRENEYG